MIKLSDRLLMVAKYVRHGKPICDIGTDHAYLPVYLLQNGIIPKAFAGDINKGPLENAESTAEKYGFSDKIELFLSDGLRDFPEDCSSDFVIAGMGGEMIAKILAGAPWIKKPDNHFVLQPQSHAEDLRKYLCENGFSILNEDVCKEGKHLYICMEAVYTGESKLCRDLFVGELENSKSPYRDEYLDYIYKRLSVRVEALSASGQNPDEIDACRRSMNYIKSII